jgi:hypothetical protein
VVLNHVAVHDEHDGAPTTFQGQLATATYRHSFGTLCLVGGELNDEVTELDSLV